MYEDVTYESLLERMLNKVRESQPNVDTREGSPVFFCLAPAAVEEANLYIQLDFILDQAFADTATRPYLILRAKERGVLVEAATKAIRKGVFNCDVPIGARFSLNALNYIVLAKMEDGVFRLQCETPGRVGNAESGQLIPIDYIDGLTTAYLEPEILIPGEDEEETEHLRQRYFNSLDSQAFGGNQKDYREKVNEQAGVGGVKVYPVFDGGYRPADLRLPEGFGAWLAEAELPEEITAWLGRVSGALTEGVVTVGGGTVRLVVIDSTYGKPSETLLEDLQEAIDPLPGQGEGMGIAPIGHQVRVCGVEEVRVDISTQITYQQGWAWQDIAAQVEEALDAYFRELAATWQEEESLIVRITRVEMALLNLEGVLDVRGTALNGETQNLPLGPDQIPVRGMVSDDA